MSVSIYEKWRRYLPTLTQAPPKNRGMAKQVLDELEKTRIGTGIRVSCDDAGAIFLEWETGNLVVNISIEVPKYYHFWVAEVNGTIKTLVDITTKPGESPAYGVAVLQNRLKAYFKP